MVTKEYKVNPLDETDIIPETDLCQCEVCGHVGEYKIEIVDTDTIDTTGHDAIMLACKDVKACLDRKEEMSRVYADMVKQAEV